MVEETPTTHSEGLAPLVTGTLSQRSPRFTVDSLESAFLQRFPSVHAESWDRTGLLVGDREQAVEKVAFALDVTVPTIELAYDAGANVLVTHHPAFIEAPDSFEPLASTIQSSGATVWTAIRCGVALMGFHTALDASRKAARVLPGLLKLEFQDTVVYPTHPTGEGYGQLCFPRREENPLPLGRFAARCTAVFARQPRVYGNFAQKLERIVTCTGSVGSLLMEAVLESRADCLVCGEIRYHDALGLSEAGVAIVELGHDVSEFPLVALLAATAREFGLSEKSIVMIDRQDNWSYPETTRV